MHTAQPLRTLFGVFVICFVAQVIVIYAGSSKIHAEETRTKSPFVESNSFDSTSIKSLAFRKQRAEPYSPDFFNQLTNPQYDEIFDFNLPSVSELLVNPIKCMSAAACPEQNGSSSIAYDEIQNVITGSANSLWYSFRSFSAFGSIPCNMSVTATLSGPGVNITRSSAVSECTGGDVPRVDFNVPLGAVPPNSRYCVNSSHHYEISNQCSGDEITEACTIVNQTSSAITNVTYQQILSTDPDIPIDTNPNAGGGLRIFPDKKVPNETISRRRIQVKAQHSEPTAGKTIYFRSFDVDDPSASAAPIDPNDSAGRIGDDNNGNVDGTTATRNGRFLAPLGSSGCVAFPAAPAIAVGFSCLTDSTGLAIVDFETTMQPGDNFTVVASDDETYITGLTLAADGVNLTDTTGAQIPASTQAANACATANMKACRADMLTVWRRLHIEVDSMKQATGNFLQGTVSKKVRIKAGATATLKDVFLGKAVNQFENGRLEIAPITAFFNVVSNTDTALTIRNSTTSAISFPNNVNIQLQNQSSTLNGFGNIAVGQTVNPGQTVTVGFIGTPLVANSFSAGQLFLTPVLTSLNVSSNTDTSLTVRNTSATAIEIPKDANFRLFDDDDFNRNSTQENLRGDEGEFLALLADSLNSFRPIWLAVLMMMERQKMY